MKMPSPTMKDVIKTGRFEIPCRLYGNDGPHLVCLNGIQQSMAMWQAVVARFAADYRIVLFDFPTQGKGRSLSGSVRASLDEEVDILYEVMKTTRVDHDVSLCTASWGGIVALAFASKYPQEVKRLLLGSIGTRPNRKMIELIQKGCSIGTGNREEFAGLIIDTFGENLPESIKRKIGTQFRTISTKNLQSFCEHGLKVISVKKISDHIDIKNIEVETIIIRGENDTIVDMDDIAFLSSRIPNCQVRTIKNVGHFLHLESEEVLDIYSDLLPKKIETWGDSLIAEC